MKYIIGLIIISGFVYMLGQQPAVLTTPRLTLRVLDIGQGDSLYLSLPNGDDLMIDAGPDDRVLAQIGRYLPIGDRQIELFISSHNHSDHIGGLVDLLNHYQVQEIWLAGSIHTTDQYLNLLRKIRDKQVPTTVVKAGTVREAGEVRLAVLHPPSDKTGILPEDQHDSTVVVKITYKEVCLLLTGDLSTRHEVEIIKTAESLQESMRCPILKITHHGSAYGTGQDWLQAVQPKIGLISVGMRNRYGHPAPSLLNRLNEFEVTTYRTDQQGALTVTTDGHQYWTTTER